MFKSIVVLVLTAVLCLAAARALYARPLAERCRSAATGRFARCGQPGAVQASQYVRKCTRLGLPCRPTRAKTQR